MPCGMDIFSIPNRLQSMPSLANVRPELKAAHEAFGKSLGNWLTSQGISQQIPNDWSKERRNEGIDDATPGPHNSSTSALVRGIALPSGVGVWQALENFNRAVAENDFRGIETTRIREIMTQAGPFMTVDGRVANMIDFIAMFAGRQAINPVYVINAEDQFNDVDQARKEEIGQELELLYDSRDAHKDKVAKLTEAADLYSRYMEEVDSKICELQAEFENIQNKQS